MKKTIELVLEKDVSWEIYGKNRIPWLCSDAVWRFFPKLEKVKRISVTVSTSSLPGSKRIQFVDDNPTKIGWIDESRNRIQRPLWDTFSDWIFEFLRGSEVSLYVLAKKSPAKKETKTKRHAKIS